MIRMGERAIFVYLLGASAALWAAACGGDDQPVEPSTPHAEARPDEGAGDEAAEPEEAPDPNAAVREALSHTRVHLDLLALAHLADVDHHGLYMDFGTPARAHYTMGRWHNGFMTDVKAGERDFTRMGTDARAFFQLDEVAPKTLRLRGRPIGSHAIVVYLNGQRAGQVDFEGDGVQEHDIPIDPARLVAGENALMLRASETRSIGGEDVAAEIDSLWLLPREVPADAEPPLFSDMARELTVGGEARRAVVVRAPTSVRWYAEIPEDAKLSFGVGASGAAEGTTARVTVTPEGADPVEVFQGPVGSSWSDQLVDLAPFAGEVARIELEVEGDGAEVGWSGPAVVVPLPEAPLADAQARSVILLLVDTLRASKLRVYNPRSRVQAEAMSAIAEDAAVFDHAQAPENWTKPSVASILTSLTPMTHNTKQESSSLPASALMVSEVFQQAGFATASFIANGYVSDRFGFDQGWDHYTNYIRESRPTVAHNVFGEALEWIEAHRGERFFAYIQTIDPHVPYDPPDATLRLYDDQPYDGPLRNRSTGLQLEDVKRGRMTLTARDRQHLEALHDAEITYHDQELTHFIERLGELGLYDEVVFAVTADHGEEFYEHGSFGHGHSVYQELLHVPLMVRWHGVIAPTRIGPTVSTMDIAPTLLEATGVDVPDVFEGHSLLSTARGVMRPGPAVGFSDKLDDRRVATAAGYKLVTRSNLTWSFFDLRHDPGEQNQIDSPSRNPIALRYLRGLLGQYLGASDRGDWLHAGTDAESRVLPASESQIDAELCRQLQSLGYIDARCDDLL